jgi:hypothetical protein
MLKEPRSVAFDLDAFSQTLGGLATDYHSHSLADRAIDSITSKQMFRSEQGIVMRQFHDADSWINFESAMQKALL